MKVTIILAEPYPHGMACTNRVHLYARGLLELGHHVQIVVPYPLEPQGKVRNHMIKGQHEGVPFRYMWRTTWRSPRFLVRRIHDIYGPNKAALYVTRARPDIILIVSNSLYLIIVFKLVASLVRATYVQEKSEIPFFKEEKLSLWQRLYIKYVYKLFDAILVISEPLKSYFDLRKREDARILKVPALVDPAVFQAGFGECGRNVVYCGTLTQHKDGILTILEAFSKACKNTPGCRLLITGNLQESPIQSKIERVMDICSLSDKVKFLGYLNESDLRKLLCRAAVLLIAKPSNRQNICCFPTKVAEYLATGNPVLATRVGEIPKYLHDGINAFLSDPDVLSFSGKLEFILMHPKEAKKVGLRGQRLAYDVFHYMKHVRRMASFFEDLRSIKN